MVKVKSPEDEQLWEKRVSKTAGNQTERRPQRLRNQKPATQAPAAKKTPAPSVSGGDRTVTPYRSSEGCGDESLAASWPTSSAEVQCVRPIAGFNTCLRNPSLIAASVRSSRTTRMTPRARSPGPTLRRPPHRGSELVLHQCRCLRNSTAAFMRHQFEMSMRNQAHGLWDWIMSRNQGLVCPLDSQVHRWWSLASLSRSSWVLRTPC